jgi:hypothetical protein
VLFEALTKDRHLRGDRVLTLDDGLSVPGHVLRVTGSSAPSAEQVSRRPATSTSFATRSGRPSRCGRTGEGDPGPRRAPAPLDDDAVHAPVAERERAIRLLNGRSAHGTLAAHGEAASRTA